MFQMIAILSVLMTMTILSGPAIAAGPQPVATAPATAPAANDPRRIYWIDPRREFADTVTPALSQVATFPNKSLAKLPGPGVVGSGAEYAFQRTVDPINPGRSAFLHRIKPGFPTWAGGNTWRSEVSASGQNDGYNIVRGQTYWMAYAFKPEADMTGTGPGVSILDVHAADGSRNPGPSPVSLYAGKAGMSLVRSWNPDFNGSDRQGESYSMPMDTTQWNYLVFNFRVHWDSTKEPFLKVWTATGTGPLVKRIDVAGPLGYNEAPVQTAQKFGLYRWDPWAGDPNQSRTLYTKGLYVFKAAGGSPVLDENAMLVLLRSI